MMINLEGVLIKEIKREASSIIIIEICVLLDYHFNDIIKANIHHVLKEKKNL